MVGDFRLPAHDHAEITKYKPAAQAYMGVDNGSFHKNCGHSNWTSLRSLHGFRSADFRLIIRVITLEVTQHIPQRYRQQDGQTEETLT